MGNESLLKLLLEGEKFALKFSLPSLCVCVEKDRRRRKEAEKRTGKRGIFELKMKGGERRSSDCEL